MILWAELRYCWMIPKQTRVGRCFFEDFLGPYDIFKGANDVLTSAGLLSSCSFALLLTTFRSTSLSPASEIPLDTDGRHKILFDAYGDAHIGHNTFRISSSTWC